MMAAHAHRTALTAGIRTSATGALTATPHGRCDVDDAKLQMTPGHRWNAAGPFKARANTTHTGVTHKMNSTEALDYALRLVHNRQRSLAGRIVVDDKGRRILENLQADADAAAETLQALREYVSGN